MNSKEYTSSFTLSTGRNVTYYDLNKLAGEGHGDFSTVPFSVKILMESLLRLQEHPAYAPEHIEQLGAWTPEETADREYPYLPSRVLLQDFTGVPCVVDLAALRSALERKKLDPALIEPQIPVDLVIDHSVQVDYYGDKEAYSQNLVKEFQRNQERYTFLKWGQQAFEKLSVLPPGLGICHQVNMEHLASCVAHQEQADGSWLAFPDTLVGTDSHTPMVNSMGVMGWGVGGIEAEAAMLGQPIPLLSPKVTGVCLTGELSDMCTPTDIALHVTERLREQGVVGHFVEFYGPGLQSLTLADRAPVANMAAEYGATMGFFPVDTATLEYLKITGRSDEDIELVETYCKAQGLFWDENSAEPRCTARIEVDLSTVEPSTAGPKRPQDRIAVKKLPASFNASLRAAKKERGFEVPADAADKKIAVEGHDLPLEHGSVAIAAITSCTNTSNPSLLIGAGLLAKKAVEQGLQVPSYVKTSLAPGSRVVTEYLKNAGLLPYLEQLGFDVVAYGCTTCIGNSGPLRPELEEAIDGNDLIVAGVLSGNRNFEGRIHPLVKANYLCSPPLVVALALAGNVKKNIYTEPLGTNDEGKDIYLKDLWPARDEIAALMKEAANPELYKRIYGHMDSASSNWNELEGSKGSSYDWQEESTYIREPSFFENFPEEPPPIEDVTGARVFGLFGDFITTDHISPAGAIAADGPAAAYLREHGVEKDDFNSFGSRRGNHEVMMRGTFANIRIQNRLVEEEGGWTLYHPDGQKMSMYDAAMKYQQDNTPLVVLAGEMYGAGSSRDWAAKGTYLLGVKAVIARSFERIHRSNLVEMGVLPMEFTGDDSADSLGLDGTETFSIKGLADDLTPGKTVTVSYTKPDGSNGSFQVKCRIDTPIEIEYYRHGGILQYVLRDVIKNV